VINLLELLGGPGRFILGLGPPPWPAPASPKQASTDPTSNRGVAPSGSESVGKSGGSTRSTTGATDEAARRN
jgi:hypothetical protein